MTRCFQIAVLLVATIAGAKSGWKAFHSEQYRYSTFYPPGWQPLTPRSQAFTAINFPQSERVEGIVVPPSGAMIEAGPTGEPTVDKEIKADLENAGTDATVDQTLLTKLPYPDACKSLRQVEYDVNLGSTTSPVYQHITSFYCEVHGRAFGVTLIYYRGNKDAEMLQAVALDVARFLRIEK